MRSMKRPVPFHRDNAISDDKVDWYRCTDIEDAAMNPLPMEEILRPSVPVARNDAKHILHAKSDASPVVGLDLGHRDDEIRCQDRSRHPQVVQAGVVRPRRYFHQFVTVEVNERHPLRTQLSIESALHEHQVGVPLMAWPFSDDDTSSAEPNKGLGGSADEQRVRIHLNAGDVFNQVRLQQNGFTTEVELEQTN